jgi:hypothetical protein
MPFLLQPGLRTRFLAGALLALTLGGTGASAAPLLDCTSFTACTPHDGPNVNPAKFDIAWLKLWMSPGAVKAVLHKEFGKKLYLQPVMAPSQFGRGNYIAELDATTADYIITVHFIELAPKNTRHNEGADQIDLKLRSQGAGAALAFTNKALQKYGPPSLLRTSLQEAPHQATWCALTQGRAGTGALIFPWAECTGPRLSVTLPSNPDYADMAVIEQALQNHAVLQLPAGAPDPGATPQPAELHLEDTQNPLELSYLNP